MNNKRQGKELEELYKLMLDELVSVTPKEDQTPLDAYLDAHLIDPEVIGEFALKLSKKWSDDFSNGQIDLSEATAGALVDGLCFGLYVGNKTNISKVILN